ncbi:MAG TPA: cytochrome c-type biogenesis protein [Gammaproteobacteria bacterium]|nr:cytochrome c-type biogenesis protein [Gammaproteobacteria bacterium]
MKKILVFIMIIFFGYVTFTCAEPQGIYTFTSKAQQTQFEQLTQQLRCLVCQNESLADSNAPLAQDLRKEIYDQVQKGSDTGAIKKYLLARYGQFILFKPAWNRLTYVLWILPFALLLMAFCILALVVYSRKKVAVTTALLTHEKQRLKELGL